MATTPPGWYDDGRGALRWWDGAQWTEHVQTPDPEPAAVDPAVAQPPVASAQAGVPAAEPDAYEIPAPTSEQPVAGELPADPAETIDTLLAPAVAPAPDAEPAPYAAPTLDAGTPYPGAASDTAPVGDSPASAPPGYPGGFPGGSAPSGAFISATEPKKSKLWILWVVIGVVLLGIVILAAVLIPIVIGMFSTGASSGGGTDDEAAAIAAVELYDEAWGTGDCDKFEQSTTEGFREVLQIPDCASFSAASQGFIDSVEGYELTVTSVETGEDAITVITSETYTSMFDEDGNPTDEAVAYDDHYAYSVVPSDGGWAIGAADTAP